MAALRAKRRFGTGGGGVILKLLGWGVRLVALGTAASIVWVGAYRVLHPPATLTMLARGLDGMDVRRTPVSLNDISPHLVRAVIAAEDARFCSHTGFDFDAMREAIEEARNGRRLRGASTISQQTAKNAFLWGGGGFPRKVAEAWFTIWGEIFWGKRRTMELYLNVAEWGDGLFGAEAAARAYFGVSAADLAPREAALLAAVLPNPHVRRADRPSDFVRRRAASIERQIRDVELSGGDDCVYPDR